MCANLSKFACHTSGFGGSLLKPSPPRWCRNAPALRLQATLSCPHFSGKSVMKKTRLHIEYLEDRVTPVTLPPGFTESVFASGLNAPTAMAVAPDGRVFVAEQGGTLRVVQNGSVLPTPF